MSTGGGRRNDLTIYRALPTTRRVLVVVSPVMFAAVSLYWSVWGGTSRHSRLLGWVMLGASVVLGYLVYRVAHTVVVHDEASSLEFRSFLGSRVVRITEIRSIAPGWLLEHDLVVKHTRGSERMPYGFPEIHEVLAYVRRGNPAVTFGGFLDR